MPKNEKDPSFWGWDGKLAKAIYLIAALLTIAACTQVLMGGLPDV